jgi:hypothetical protein
MRAIYRLLSVIISASIIFSASGFGWAEQATSAAGNSRIASPGELSVTAESPELSFLANLTEEDVTSAAGGSISGHVYQADGVTPIAGAYVYAYEAGNYDNQYAETADDGSYTVSTLNSGGYYVEAGAEGYLSTYYDGIYDTDGATLVKVVAPQDTPGIDFKLSTGGSISGHVYQADGVTPIAGTEVLVEGIETYDYEDTVTAEDGSYIIPALSSDSYRVYVEAEGYLTIYYDGAYDEEEATPVKVVSPQETPGIDFNLSKGGSISGHVYQSDGVTPVADAQVTADGNYANGYVDTTADGSYTIDTLYSDSYLVYVRASGYLKTYYVDAYSSKQATPVDVISPQDTPDIDISLKSGGSISGHVYQADGVTPLKNAYVYASLTGAGYSYSQRDYSDSKGAYQISTLVPGNYIVKANINGSPYQYYNNTADPEQAIQVAVTDSVTTSGIDFVLDTGGSISGHVYRSDGVTPVANAEVYAENDDFSDSVDTSADGSYIIRDLYSDSYKVHVRASGYLTTYYNGVFDEGEATPVKVVSPQDTPDIDFTLQEGGPYPAIFTRLMVSLRSKVQISMQY